MNLALIDPTPSNLVVGLMLIIALAAVVCLAAAMFSAPTVPPEADGPEPDWKALYSAEQVRLDRLRSLFERLKEIDDCSAAARPHELRAIETEYRELIGPQPTRRNEP